MIEFYFPQEPDKILIFKSSDKTPRFPQKKDSKLTRSSFPIYHSFMPPLRPPKTVPMKEVPLPSRQAFPQKAKNALNPSAPPLRSVDRQKGEILPKPPSKEVEHQLVLQDHDHDIQGLKKLVHSMQKQMVRMASSIGLLQEQIEDLVRPDDNDEVETEDYDYDDLEINPDEAWARPCSKKKGKMEVDAPQLENQG